MQCGGQLQQDEQCHTQTIASLHCIALRAAIGSGSDFAEAAAHALMDIEGLEAMTIGDDGYAACLPACSTWPMAAQ